MAAARSFCFEARYPPTESNLMVADAFSADLDLYTIAYYGP